MMSLLQLWFGGDLYCRGREIDDGLEKVAYHGV